MLNVLNEDHVKPYGDITVNAALTLFLYWLKTGESYRRLENITKYPKSSMKYTFSSIRNSLLKWSDRFEESNKDDFFIRSEKILNNRNGYYNNVLD